MRLLLVYILLTCQILATSQTMNTILVSGGGDGDNCVVSDTRANLINLRNAGGLVVGCHYVLTDHIQGRLVAGTTIQLHAIASNEFSENVSVNTTYDNEGWRGIYDIDRNLVLELTDNRGNIARGINGNEVANFDWGNTFITDVTVDNATWNTTYGQSRTVNNVQILDNSVLTTTSWVSGTINRLLMTGASTINMTSASASLLNYNSHNGSNTNLNLFTGGSTLSNYNLYSSTVNYSNSTIGVTISNVTLNASTINHIGVSTGTLTGSNIVLENASTINHNNGAGNLSLNRVLISNNSSITQSSGTISLSDYYVEASCQIIQSTGTTGSINLSNGRLLGNSIVQNLADYNVNGTRYSASENSNTTISTGAIGVATLTGATLKNQGGITITATSTAGNVNISNTNIVEGALIQKQNTGALTVINSTLNTQGRIQFNAIRSMNITRLIVSNLGTISITGTAGAVADQITDCAVDTRATMTFSATGAASNSMLYSSVSGLSGSLSITGTSTGQNIQRTTSNNSTITMSNNAIAMTIDLSSGNNQGNITVQNMTVTKSLSYLTANGFSSITINNPTGVGSISFISASNGGAITIGGTATVSQYLAARNQGAINQNGGQTINMTKEMVGTITTGNFTHSNVLMISPQSITLTGNNSNRTTYFGLTSTVPLF